MNDKALQSAVIDELEWDASVDAGHVGVSASNGVVTLTGKVRSYAAKLEAERAAGRVAGVKAVAEEIQVEDSYAPSMDDADIASRALQVLAWDVSIPRDSVKVKVEKGWVTLTGTLDWNYQRTAAENDVRRLHGVKGVTNNVTIKSRVAPSDVREKIRAALTRNAQVEASGIIIAVDGGKVTLSGTVPRWADRYLIERTAWSAPGVTAIEDKLAVA